MNVNIQCPRYLVSFDVRHLPHFFTDVLIIGTGLAGLRAALAVDKSQFVTVLTKADELTLSNSDKAQGGIASVLDPTDRFEKHIADTLVAGVELCDEAVVKHVIEEGPRRIAEMIEMGAHFDLHDDGSLDLGREGGHGMNRVAHAQGDATGHELVRTVIEQTKKASNIRVCTSTYVIDLLTVEGRCVGALLYSKRHGRAVIWAKQTIIATGGLGQLYRETTNSAIATGDGMALALRAGAKLRDMEFVQFHPTVLYVAGASRHLISEAVRGEGAYLVDKNGYRFMPDYDERAELAPRDIVSRSIVAQMKKTSSATVFLTVAHKDADEIRHRFPGIYATCLQYGIDITKDRIPVRPGAHYTMGGVLVDMDGRTTIPGLWCVGEASSSGLHGANRLASNSLLEALVYGVTAGIGASQAAKEISDSDLYRLILLSNEMHKSTSVSLNLEDLSNSLKSLMWHNAGVQRNAELMEEGRASLEHWQQYMLATEQQTPLGWELQNMLMVSLLLIHAALQRQETRGGHTRTDFPQRDPNWCRHQTFVRLDESTLELERT